MARVVAVAMAAFMAMNAASCSWIAVVPARGKMGEDPGPCTEADTMPVIDTVMTGVMALTALLVAAHCSTAGTGNNQDGSPSQPCSDLAYVRGVYVPIGLTVAFGASAYTGFRRTAKCSRHKAAAQWP